MNNEDFWDVVKNYLATTKYVQTLKKHAEALVVDVNDEAVFLKQKDGKIIKCEKKYFLKALDILNKNSKVRQKDILGSGTERYILGIMSKLPGFYSAQDTISGKHYIYKKQL